MATSLKKLPENSHDIDRNFQLNRKKNVSYALSLGEVQEQFGEVYTKVRKLIDMPGFDIYIKGKEGILHNVDKERLDMRSNDIKKIDCPIVITGETSSGKSTIINLLIGEEVLPTRITASTKKLCRIKNTKTLTITARSDQEELLQTWCFEDLVQMSEKVKVLATTKDSKTRYLDIMLPFSMVQGSMIIVDTPGISDEEQENEARIMMDYLKNALAVVFVANVANAGGIQSDRLCRIITKLRNLMKKEMCCFNAEDTIFVLNKWDTIDHDEGKDEYFESAKTKLRTLWEEIDEKHILKLSAVKTPEIEEYKAMFEEFEKILRKVIAKNENKRMKSHFEFLRLFLGECHKLASTNLHKAKTEEEEISKRLKSLETETEKLRVLIQNVQHSLPSLIECFLDLAFDEFEKYLQSDYFQKTIFEDQSIEKCTRFTVKGKLSARFDEVATEWEKKNIHRIFLKAVKIRFGEKCAAFCQTLVSVKDNLIALNYGIWLSYFGAHAVFFIGLIGTVARGLIMTPVVGIGLTAILSVAGYDWKNVFSTYEQCRDESFQNKKKVCSEKEIKKVFHKRYAKDISKDIEKLSKHILPSEKHELEERINITRKDLISKQRDVSILSELSSTSSELFDSLNSLKFLQTQ